jgi:hypothetical protein
VKRPPCVKCLRPMACQDDLDQFDRDNPRGRKDGDPEPEWEARLCWASKGGCNYIRQGVLL